jgi:hypothetical protein
MQLATISKDAGGRYHCKIERPDQGSYLYFNEFSAGFSQGATLDPSSIRVYVCEPLSSFFMISLLDLICLFPCSCYFSNRISTAPAYSLVLSGDLME